MMIDYYNNDNGKRSKKKRLIANYDDMNKNSNM
jgi:hypothetical protein